MSVLSELQSAVRGILKSLDDKKPKADDKAQKTPVPDDPGDPDELQPDPRAKGASPTKGDLNKAKEDGSDPDGDTRPDDEGGDDGESTEGQEDGSENADDGTEPDNKGDATEPDKDPDDKDDKGRPVSKGFDEFGDRDMSPDEVRRLMKSLDYGVTPPIPEDKLLNGGEDLEATLKDILTLLTHVTQSMESNQAITSDLMSEIERMKKGMAEHDRQITKALQTLGDPLTAPAEVPRAISKAIVTPPAAPANPALPGAEVADQIFAGLKSGAMTHAQAMQKCREARGL
jgi:hypothetical protein